MPGFDDEVDDARKRLESSIEGDVSAFDEGEALEKLLPQIQERIASRRLKFTVGEDDEDPSIEVVHVSSD